MKHGANGTAVFILACLAFASRASGQAAEVEGGQVTNLVGTYRQHVFTTSGVFKVLASGTLDVLVVGGGGGGGETIGGGGGGGGVIFSESFPVEVGDYTVTVGSGGAGGWGSGYPAGVKGQNSTFTTLTAIGGGAGGGFNVAASGVGGSAGGNGGGGGLRAGYTPDQGNDGGIHWNNNAGGGAGGAGETGAAGTSGGGGKGGDGVAVFGQYFGGGGGGGSRDSAGIGPGDGGLGGGGGGGRTTVGENGAPNTGGGGGGGGFVSDLAGGSGGSGIVIVQVFVGKPNIGNLPVSEVGVDAAWLNGALYATGTSATAVFLFWGASDGETNGTAWGHTNIWAAPQATGVVAYHAENLDADSTYYYRFAASNELGLVWAAPTEIFMTGEVELLATADAMEDTLTPGTFLVYRPIGVTNEELCVTYAQTGGTAVPDVDFVPLSGTVTLPAGAVSAPILVTPLKNYANQSDTTVELTLTGAPAPLGLASNATLTIRNEAMPASPTNVWIRNGGSANASVAGNWSLARAPVDGDPVYLGFYAPTADMTWDLSNIVVSSWLQDAPYTGVVTILTKHPGALDFPMMTIAGNCTLAGGVWTHTANTTGQIHRLAVTVQGDLTVGAGGWIRADGRGYAALQGPAKASGSGQGTPGAGHGGVGGLGTYSTADGLLPPYGSFAEPQTLGSGASSAGGGHVRLVVNGTTRLDGAITANGLPAGGWRAGGGAGGSVFLTTGWLEGDGQMAARGGPGDSNYGGAGGGGRVAVVLQSSAAFGNVAMSAASVMGTSRNPGSAGTVYRQTAGQEPGEGVLVIDYENLAVSWALSTLMPEPSAFNGAPDLTALQAIIVTNKGILGINTNTIFDFAVGNLRTHNATNSFVMVNGTNGLSFPPLFVVATNYALLLNVPVSAVGDWLVPTNAVLSHRENNHDERYKLDLTLHGNLTVEAGGEISVTRKGYAIGLGPGSAGAANYLPGSSYGGMGSRGNGLTKLTYGSALAPTNLGSGGRYPGVGAILLDVHGTTTVHGLLFARERESARWNNAPSGGTIWLRTRHLQGSGLLDAAGGYGGGGDGGAGGGGRISVILTGSESFDGVRFRAPGGNNNPVDRGGAAGTIYTETPGQAAGRGRLLIANDNQNYGIYHTNALTLLPAPTLAPADELKRVTLVVSNRASVALTGDLEIGDLFVLTNTLNFLLLNGHTLTVNSKYHADWGREQDVIYAGGEIVWRAPNRGTLIFIR